ncbi:MAG TPA: IMP dehydrogenase [Deltaproteobacteria bacterium]|nr:IMP dehydrogenase [Deltaproteobacteria bacterium]
MAILTALHHETTYRFDRLVTLSPHIVRLRPAPHTRVPILSYALRVEPAEHFLNWQQDPCGNYLARLVFPQPTRILRLIVDFLAELHVLNPFDFFLEPSAERFPFRYDQDLSQELAPYREVSAVGPRLDAFLSTQAPGAGRTIDVLVDLNRRVKDAVEYVIRMEPGVQMPEETLELACGSCRDSAWLLVQILRHLGFAARFASGYLVQLAADEVPLEGPPGPTHDFTDLHAWAEVYLPGAGWVGLDPTSGLLTGEGHIPLACTPDPLTAAPVTGRVDPSQVEFSVAMTVTRVHEDPRVTKPYTDTQWQKINDLGQRIDAELLAGDVRLLLGGEPTFVAIDDVDAPEWNTTALGPTKRLRAEDLLRRLQGRLAPGALLHFGQGKWYPGESLPRWALGCYWRRDGAPIWQDLGLVAGEATPGGFGDTEAQRFVTALAKRLGVDPGFALPAFEDLAYYLWRERRLPVNIDPLDSRLDDPEERARLAGVFERGLSARVGYALPLSAELGCDPVRWRSGRWRLRSEALFLVPGDSPMGYRLPLDSLPWLPPLEALQGMERDPFEDRPPLEPPRPRLQHTLTVRPRSELDRSGGWESAGEIAQAGLAEPTSSSLRTALCVEPRGGVLHIFMPPLFRLEEYLDLVGAVEETASGLRLPVRIEGYAPPLDPRLEKLEVTPDPGVIEVNVPPAASWSELVHNTSVLYEEARQARLRADKFLLDGRHTGTGGGNHLTLGGPTAAESPILRRPDLLRSLVGYWQDHPALSFLFSGLFIGPTSQAPRVDEARSDALVELELAFQELGENPPGQPPWLVDRILRHILVDVTGNTHRTEFCIDKLFSPDGPRGRLGLVELRAIEMPPHPRMSLVQQLLLRGLVARFWREPYKAHLVRWETQLHDRFMLPHFVEQDFRDVLLDLQRSGFDLDIAWFAPHLAFRFPLIGSVVRGGLELELRQALEPWHVLGEQPEVAGTVRYVDFSLDRLEVKVRGGVGERYRVTCNGRALPLHSTGIQGEFVAGVRYRAWRPTACLHPTIPVHAPLVFDVVDTWLERSLGGCTYHVAHPGGRNYETFPVNANEAEARRVARFSALGHTPGRIVAPSVTRSREHPFTLDLRRS